MSFAFGTQIAVNANNQKSIETFNVGDTVYAADKNNSATWKQQPVQFSSGIGGGRTTNEMIYIEYTLNGENKDIIVTQDHCFLSSSKQPIRANQLEPGAGQLLSANGKSVGINMISMGSYQGGIHDIAVDMSSGHWIIANGLISGDYAMQIYGS
jgi:hypothetical protein